MSKIGLCSKENTVYSIANISRMLFFGDVKLCTQNSTATINTLRRHSEMTF